MNKVIILFIFTILAFSVSGQVMNQSLRAAYGYTFQRGQFDSTLLAPLDSALRFNAPRRGAIIYNSGDSAIYAWNGAWWIKQGRSGSPDALTWNSLLSPLMTQSGIPIQPTTSLIVALGQLQQQINDFIGRFIELNPSLSQPGAAAKITGSLTVNGGSGKEVIINRPNRDTSTADVVFQTAGVQSAYIGHSSKGNSDMLMNATYGNIAFYTSDTNLLKIHSFRSASPATPARVHVVIKQGFFLLGDSLLPLNIPSYPLHITNASDTSIYAVNKIVTGTSILTTDSSRYVITSDWVKRQAYLKQSNANWQTITQTGNTTNQIVKIIGAGGSLAGTGGGLELAWDGTKSSIQSFNRTTATSQPMQLSAALITTTSKLAVNKSTDNGSSFQVTGSESASITTVTGSTTLDATHHTVLVNNSGAVTITLPAASTANERIYWVKKVSNNGSVVSIQAAGAELIDGTNTAQTLSAFNNSYTIQCNGTSWFIF